jgi:hypothetical protein
MDPVHSNLFEVTFTIPEALQADFGADVAIITEQIQNISGLGTLDKGVETGEQKFMGTSRSYLNPKPDNTYHDIKVTLALNLREGTDNFIYKLFKAWNRLSYDLTTGETVLKKDYCSDWIKVRIANRAGDVYREIIYKDVMLKGGLTFQDELNYDTNDAQTLEVNFRSDWALETNL